MAEANDWQVTDDGWLVKVDELPEVTKAEVQTMLEKGGVPWEDLFFRLKLQQAERPLRLG